MPEGWVRGSHICWQYRCRGGVERKPRCVAVHTPKGCQVRQLIAIGLGVPAGSKEHIAHGRVMFAYATPVHVTHTLMLLYTHPFDRMRYMTRSGLTQLPINM
jgi:hypothetical protein